LQSRCCNPASTIVNIFANDMPNRCGVHLRGYSRNETRRTLLVNSAAPISCSTLVYHALDINIPYTALTTRACRTLLRHVLARRSRALHSSGGGGGGGGGVSGGGGGDAGQLLDTISASMDRIDQAIRAHVMAHEEALLQGLLVGGVSDLANR
jgi:hypothetical protein